MRSQHWYAGDDRDAFIHRAWMRRGLPDHAFDGRPQIVICNTWSDLTPCNGHFREIAEHVKRGVWEAGGVPLELPVPSLGETLLRPTAMLFRDLAAMVVEELIRANPVDGVVLLGGCDKTVPPADGRGVGRPAGAHGHRRAHAQRALAAGRWVRHRRLGDERGGPRRADGARPTCAAPSRR